MKSFQDPDLLPGRSPQTILQIPSKPRHTFLLIDFSTLQFLNLRSYCLLLLADRLLQPLNTFCPAAFASIS
jgi:hypothetical protein